MRMARFAVAALLLLVPACGGGTHVSEAAATRLQPKVQALREAAATGSQDAANRELAELRALVGELSATEELSERGARRVLAAADRVEANLQLLATTTTTITPTTVAPATTTTAPPEDEEEKGDDDKEEEKKKDDEDKEKEKEPETEPTVIDTTTPGNDGGNNSKD